MTCLLSLRPQVLDASSAYEAPITQEDGSEKNESIDELANLQVRSVHAARLLAHVAFAQVTCTGLHAHMLLTRASSSPANLHRRW